MVVLPCDDDPMNCLMRINAQKGKKYCSAGQEYMLNCIHISNKNGLQIVVNQLFLFDKYQKVF